MENLTDSSGSWTNDLDIDCNDLTNNGFYLIFVGYILPLLSPRVRNYGREILCKVKNAGKVASQFVSVTEYGFEKIQGLSNNEEMTDFLQRVCNKKNYNIVKEQLVELSWFYSGDTSNGKKMNIQQTWTKLLHDLDTMSIKGRVKDRSP